MMCDARHLEGQSHTVLVGRHDPGCSVMNAGARTSPHVLFRQLGSPTAACQRQRLLQHFTTYCAPTVASPAAGEAA